MQYVHRATESLYTLHIYKTLLDEVFVISMIIKVDVRGYQPKAEADKPYQDLDCG